jgi:PAS domain S-box-containing protein
MNELAELRRRIAELKKSETGLKRAEEERIKAEEHIRRTLDNVLVGCMIIGFDWTYLYVNDVAARHGHQNRENLIGRTMLEMYPGVEKSAVFAAYRRCMEKRIHQRLESEYTFADGTSNWYDLSIEPVPEGIFVLSMDITERKRVEEDLKTANKRFEEVLNSIDSLVCAIDMRTYEVLFINKFGRYVWGDIEGKICWQTLQKGQSGPCEFCTNNRLIGQDMKPSETVVWEFQNTFNKRWYECRDRAIYWPNGWLVRIGFATDITERKRAEENLHISEAKYHSIFDHVVEGLYHTTLDGRFIIVNPSLAHIFGYESPQEFLSKITNVKQLYVDPNRRDELVRLIQTQEVITGFEAQLYRKDSSIIWISLNIRALRDASSRITGLEGTLLDITERKKAEEALRQSERQFKSTFENAAVGMAHVGLDGRLLRVNDTFCKITGYPPEELVTKTFQEITHPEDLAADVAQARELAEGRIPHYSMEKRYFRKDGSIVWVNLTASVQRDLTGQPTHFIAVVENISDRKQIEEALKESEGRYRTIIEFSNDMIWVLDTDGRYQFVNKRIEEFSRLKLDYFLGKSFIQFIDKQDVDRMIDVLHKTLNGEPQHYEITVKALDGNDLTLSVNTAPMYSKGKAVGIVSFGRDITERKKAEEQIKEHLKQKLKKSNVQRKLLWYLIKGTRGGKTRALILKRLAEKSYNAHQLAKALELDYKTIRHHLQVLVNNGIITRRSSDVFPDIYFISKNIESDLNEMDMEL